MRVRAGEGSREWGEGQEGDLVAGPSGQRDGVTLGDRGQKQVPGDAWRFSEFGPNPWVFKCQSHVSEPIKKIFKNTENMLNNSENN